MTPEEKITVCSKCQNRKMSLTKGILCGLTDEKPQFEDTCESYVLDEQEIAAEKARKEYSNDGELSDPGSIDGELIGAGWFRIIAVLSILNILLYFVDISFIFGLSSTQLLQLGIEYEIINPVLGILGICIMPAFYFVTWWLTAKKGYRFCYNLGWFVYLIDALIGVYLYMETKENALFADMGFHIFVLLFCFKIFKVNAFMNAGKKFDNLVHKIIYTLFAFIAIGVSAMSVTMLTDNDDAKLNEVIESARKNLPYEIEYGVTCTDMLHEGDSIVYTYTIDYVVASDFSAEDILQFASSDKEMILSEFASKYPYDKDIKLLLDTLIGMDLTLEYRYYDCNSVHIYSVIITPTELKTAI